MGKKNKKKIIYKPITDLHDEGSSTPISGRKPTITSDSSIEKLSNNSLNTLSDVSSTSDSSKANDSIDSVTAISDQDLNDTHKAAIATNKWIPTNQTSCNNERNHQDNRNKNYHMSHRDRGHTLAIHSSYQKNKKQDVTSQDRDYGQSLESFKTAKTSLDNLSISGPPNNIMKTTGAQDDCFEYHVGLGDIQQPHTKERSLNAEAKVFMPNQSDHKNKTVQKSIWNYDKLQSQRKPDYYNQQKRGSSLGAVENWRDSGKNKEDKDTSSRYSEGNSYNLRNQSGFQNPSSRHSPNIVKPGRELFDRNSEKPDKEFQKFQEEEREQKIINAVRTKEIEHDLFTMSKEYSLAHCVAEDMRMGSGIAVNFKREFKDQGILLNQRQKAGGLAFLEDETDSGSRFIYYLVTKKLSNGKPTYDSFWSSIKKMRDHIDEHKVKKLAIPRLGCGLDRLEWNRVQHMIEFLFREVDIEIVVCNFQQSEEASPQPPSSYCKVVNVEKSVADIEEYTTIIYLSTEDGNVSSEMEKLDEKFSFLAKFRQEPKKLGSLIKFENIKKNYILYGCIVRKTLRDPVDFKCFEDCVTQINKNNRKDIYEYVAIQTIEDTDDLINDKLLTILRNYLRKVDIYVCWTDKLATCMPTTYSQI